MRSILALLALTAFAPPSPAQCQLDELALPHPGDGDQYGRAVALDGNTLLVGAPLRGPAGNKGAVYVWERGADGWSLKGELARPAGVARFGSAIALDGGRCVVGSPGAQLDASGQAFVYDRGADGWRLTGILRPEDGVAGSFGSAVAVDGDVVAVGDPARSNLPLPLGHGAVFVFTRSAEGWARESVLELGGAAARLGEAVAVSGTTVFAGAPLSAAGGEVVAFDLIAGSWRIVDVVSGADDGERFGSSLAWSSPWLLAGAPANDESAPGEAPSGAAYVFERSATGLALSAQLFPVSEPNGAFGTSVDLSGSEAIVGSDAPSGFAFRFSHGAAGWERTAIVSLPYEQATFARAVAIDGGTWVTGCEHCAFGDADLAGQTWVRGSESQCFDVAPVVTATDPDPVPSLLPDSRLLLHGVKFDTLTAVTVDGQTLEASQFEVLSNTLMAMELPLLSSLGEVELVLAGEFGTQVSALVVEAADPPAARLGAGLAPEPLTSSAPVSLTLGGQPGHVAFLFASPDALPSLAPGIATLGIGNNFSSLFLVGTFPIEAPGWAQTQFQFAGLPFLTFVNLQAVVYDPVTGALPAPSSNVVLGLYTF